MILVKHMKKIISFISVASLVAITMLVLPANVGAQPPVAVTTIPGCMNSTATNYNSLANVDDGSCTYPPVSVSPSGGGGLTTYTPPSSGTLPPPNSNGTIPSFPNTGGDTLLPPPPAPAGQVLGAEKFIFTLFLKKGPPYHFSTWGNEVMELQKFLDAAGYGPLSVDGKFGVKTKASVVRFQIANGLKGDGIVGPLTRAVLNK